HGSLWNQRFLRFTQARIRPRTELLKGGCIHQIACFGMRDVALKEMNLAIAPSRRFHFHDQARTGRTVQQNNIQEVEVPKSSARTVRFRLPPGPEQGLNGGPKISQLERLA